ncbi:hypothetical protein [Blastococcus sp. CT_GayMR16]|uniref:hypothetical protein n=1 Tax=Blastococcus sp. CT_GayMR16 TaxID=2559607 RepID=UPI001073A366|nr:hypothetical protein [Blastococcus sp. CT_GayMR16]TFV86176.1 hypothetical protein E4P38_18160 [Blastococcus sp. CT_GayMR16]
MTAARPSSGPAAPHGATPVGGDNRGGGRKRALLLGALLLAILIVAALLLSQCGSDDPDESGASGSGTTSTSSSGRSSASSSSAGATAGSSGAAAAAGSGQIVTADGRSVLDLVAQADPAAALGALAGQPVTGTGVRVLSVPADEGFWVGTSDQQRVWVQLTGEVGESPYQVTEGDTVDFEGTVVAHDAAFAAGVGVDDAEGAGQLTSQGSHLEVAKSAVALSR